MLMNDSFKNPGSIYRGAPFWAWNNRLDAEQLKRQIDCFKEMGLGGFHMHPRTGMDTEYLSDEFFDMIKACRDHAEANDMLAWLYDEDRWPSGAAGGIVTRDERYRARHLLFTPRSYAEHERGDPRAVGDERQAAPFAVLLHGEQDVRPEERLPLRVDGQHGGPGLGAQDMVEPFEVGYLLPDLAVPLRVGVELHDRVAPRLAREHPSEGHVFRVTVVAALHVHGQKLVNDRLVVSAGARG